MKVKTPFHLPGAGLLKGMVVTAKNFVQSYVNPERMVTEEYPEQKPVLPENNRNFPFLVHDGDDPEAGLRCVACKICERECPPQCIYIVQEKDEQGKPVKQPRIFDIDISVCMSCQICVEVCPFEAIMMDQEYELSTLDRFLPLLHNKQRLAKSNEYFHRIHPTDAAETDAIRAAKEAKKTRGGQEPPAKS